MKNKITIRRMNIDDVEAVYKIENSTFSIPWSKQSFKDEMQQNVCARYLVCLLNNQIIGYAGIWAILEEGHVTNIAIDDKFRGKGYGKKLTQELIQYSANLGVQYITLEVRRSNFKAIQLYKNLGFEQVNVRKAYYEDNHEDGLLMVLSNMPEIEPDFKEEYFFEDKLNHL